MIRAPQLERWMSARRGCVATSSGAWYAAGQVRGPIKLDAFQRGVTVADMLREMLERAVPEDGAAS